MQTPLEILQSALDAGVGDVEHTLIVSQDLYAPDTIEFDDAYAEFLEKYNDLVQQFELRWGPPAFDDGMGNSKFPKWYEAEFLACWQKGSQSAYIAFRHDDKELPFMLVFGLKKAKAPGSGSEVKLVKQLETEAARLSAAIGGKTVVAVRRPAKDMFVIEFAGGDFIAINIDRSCLKVKLPGKS